ncbi:AAA family ATPase [Acinetobacter baumannii]|uniref:AAA family ATPase n=1 Tax=Acinetobacter baumannii TaxID=470 RepID=UPI001CB7C945|nr:AAA family ATPase [Acinetobacter baumannii]MBZ0373022.1 AAA family ATPase [Acinetobacter baumannii]MCL8263636.1 AAA family ATPase [Acinetobacter baumannii]
MRLDYLKIGSAKDSHTHQFKNLKDVSINFDEKEWITVVIGWNGTGKSNVLEALAVIFGDLLDLKKKPLFYYEIIYKIGKASNQNTIKIIADPDLDPKEQLKIYIKTQNLISADLIQTKLFEESSDLNSSDSYSELKLNDFLVEDSNYLPKYIFSYYSGHSERMFKIFEPALKDHYEKLMKFELSDENFIRKKFYALPEHSQFVLLSFLSQLDDSSIGLKFLEEHFGIDPENALHSVLFILRQPPWNGQATGDKRVWGTVGDAQTFLSKLYDISLAPITLKQSEHQYIWSNKKKSFEYKYLYLKDPNDIKQLGYTTPRALFNAIESVFISLLIKEIRVRVRLKNNSNNVVFQELSEGEQQLLTVLGLLKFTAGEESLFLLDEPDTHLNPKWSVDYIKYLKMFISNDQSDEDQTSHIVLTTHNPIAIAELEKQQIQILHRKDDQKIYADQPDQDPKGMGYAGIITSDMFGLGSSLDKETNAKLLELNFLSSKKNQTDQDKLKIQELRDNIANLDFNFHANDKLFQEYMRARFDLIQGNSYDQKEAHLVEAPVVTNETKQKALLSLIKSLIK